MKKCLAILLLFLMVFNIANFTAFAESTKSNTSFSVKSVTADAGTIVDVNIELNNNPGIIGAIIRLTYDDALVLKGATKGSAFSALEMTKPGKFISPCQFTWDTVDIDTNDIKDGTVLTLSFEVPNNATSGTKYNIGISCNNGDIINKSLDVVNASFNSGYIEIKGENSTEPEEPEVPTPTDKTIISAEKRSITLGQSVDINITILNNPGVLGASLKVNYGDLILKSATCGNAFSALEMTKPGKYISPCQFIWDSVELDENDIKDGVILTLSFDLPSNATSGKKYPIEISSSQGDIIDKNLNAVSVEFVAGEIAVSTVCKHNYVRTVIKEPDCNNTGLYSYTCSLCGDSYNETPDALGHKIVEDHAIAPTCTTTGLTVGSHCSVCGEIVVSQSIIESTGHNFNDDSQYCLNGCGTKNPNYKDPIQSECKHRGYDTYEVITKKAGIGVDGTYEIRCSNCNKVISTDGYSGFNSIKLSSNKYTYDGKIKAPKVYGVYGDGELCDLSKGYADITYSKGRKNIGEYKVTVKLKGVFTGSQTLIFTIIPKATTISSVTSKSKGFTVKWKKQATSTTGYQIQYSTNKSFKSGNKTITVKSTKTTSKTVKKLKAKKTYYIRVRTYKTVGSKNYYSNWSKVKKITTKK